MQRLLGALLEQSDFELITFQNQPSKGGEGVPDAMIQSSCRLLIETKVKRNSVQAKQLSRHLKRLDDASEATCLLLLLTPDNSKPAAVDALKDGRLVWASFAALDQAIFARTLKKVHSSDGNSNHAVAVLNIDLNIIGWNDEVRELVTLESVEVLGKPVNEVITGHGENADINLLLKSTWEGESVESEGSIESEQGKITEVRITASKFYSQGNPAGYTIVLAEK